jgi:hypothetical protein
MCVRTQEGLTPLFQSSIGVKQGCPLSPTLFGLFLDDLEQWVMSADGVELPALRGHRVPPLLYADDLLLVSVTAAGLQAQLGVLERYCERWGLTVNVEKTKVVVFPASSRVAARPAPRLTYRGERLATAPSFRYLGVEVHQLHAFGPFACAELGRAGLRALHAMRRKLSHIGTSDFGLQRRLFQALVLPVVSYGCEVLCYVMLHVFNVCLRDNHCPSQTGHKAHAAQTQMGPSLLQPEPADRNGCGRCSSCGGVGRMLPSGSCARSCGTRWGECRKASPLLWCWPRQGFTPLPLTGASW